MFSSTPGVPRAQPPMESARQRVVIKTRTDTFSGRDQGRATTLAYRLSLVAWHDGLGNRKVFSQCWLLAEIKGR